MQTGDRVTLDMRDVTFGYARNGAPVLSGFNLIGVAGAVLWLVGRNGSGKSTVGRVLTGQVRPWSGVVEVGGCSPSYVPISRRPRLSFLIHQRTYLGFMKAQLGQELRAASRSFREARNILEIDQLTTALRLTEVLDQNPLGLSYSQAWRAALAIGYLTDPVVLFIDELPNLRSTLTLHALTYVLERRCSEGKISLVTAHSIPPDNLPQSSITRL